LLPKSVGESGSSKSIRCAEVHQLMDMVAIVAGNALEGDEV